MLDKQCPWCQSTAVNSVLETKDYFLSKEVFSIYKCENCHLRYTYPAPHGDNLYKYYETIAYLSHQDSQKGFVAKLYNAIKRSNIKSKVRIATQKYKVGNCLDIGCGVGDFLLQAKKMGWRVSGIEPSGVARGLSEKKLKEKIYSDGYKSNFSNNTFDLITMWHVLEHVSDLRWQTEQLAKWIKSEGRLVIAVPNYRSWDAKHYRRFWAAYDVPRHLYHFDRDSIQNVLSASQWKLERIYPMNWDSFYVAMLSEKYKGRSMALLRAGFYGLISNIASVFSGESSSLIYVFKRR